MAIAAKAHLVLGAPQSALEIVNAALASSTGHWPECTAALHYVRTEALLAVGDTAGARAAAADARGFVMRLAETIDEAELRRSFLENVQDNVSILRIARELGGAEA
jgi:hypothetical protein